VGEVSALEGAKKKADARVEVLEQKVRVFYFLAFLGDMCVMWDCGGG